MCILMIVTLLTPDKAAIFSQNMGSGSLTESGDGLREVLRYYDIDILRKRITAT